LFAEDLQAQSLVFASLRACDVFERRGKDDSNEGGKQQKKGQIHFQMSNFLRVIQLDFDFIQKPHRFCHGEKFSATSFYGDEIVFPSMNRIFSPFTSRKSERKFTLPFLTQTIYRFPDSQVSPKGTRVEKL
jgi:hypothetical protein